MATPSVKIQEKQKMLSNQNAKEVAQYMKERGKLDQEISHYSNCEAFLYIKAMWPQSTSYFNVPKT